MAQIIGYVTSLKGVFFAKNSTGEMRVLEDGSPVYDGETLVGKGAANSSDLLVVTMEGSGDQVEVTADKPVRMAQVDSDQPEEEGNLAAQAVEDGEVSFADVEALIAELGLEDTDTAAGVEAANAEDGSLNLGAFTERTGDAVNIDTGLFEGPIVDTAFTLDAIVPLQAEEEIIPIIPEEPIPEEPVNDVPVIGDLKVMLPNESGYQVELLDQIKTSFSTDGGNTFSWLPDQAKMPELFVDGEPVEIQFDDSTASVRGVVNGQEVFSFGINMQDNDGSDFSYQQADVILSSRHTLTSSLSLTDVKGSGFFKHQLMTYEDADGSSFSAVVRVNSHEAGDESFAALSGSAIGVNDANMDALEWLSLDFVGPAFDNLNMPTWEEMQKLVADARTPIMEMTVSVVGFNPASEGDEVVIRIHSGDPTLGTQQYEEVYLSQILSEDGSYVISAESGLPMTNIAFYTYDAAPESQFELHLESVLTVASITDIAMEFGYQISDVDGDTDQGMLYLNLDSNNEMEYASDYNYIDGGSGQSIDSEQKLPRLNAFSEQESKPHDVLQFGNEFSTIDLSQVGTDIKNIEVVDLREGGGQSLVNLTLEDVLNITDDQNVLKVRLDGQDSFAFADQGDWSEAAPFPVYDFETGTYYDVFESQTENATVMVENLAIIPA